jgi:hypothetical protein
MTLPQAAIQLGLTQKALRARLARGRTIEEIAKSIA